MKKLHYEDSGDNYKLKDPFKIIALRAASKTDKNLNRFKKYGIIIKEVKASRGESAFRVQIKSNKELSFQLAHVEESIGTKNIIADEVLKTLGKSYFHSIAIDNVASIMNDLSTTGAFPVSFMLHLAAYPNEWYLNKEIIEPLLEGTKKACDLSGAAWGGGESGTDRDIIMPGKALLSGSATGIIFEGQELSEEKLALHDRIILLGSSGVHTNGITLLRKELLKKLPQGYKTKLSDGRTYGESLLDPSTIYASLVEDAVNKVEIHYAVHITGHGWRKLMRANKNFRYVIDKITPSQPIFETIKKYTHSSDYDMYDTYNMGAGFALFVPEKSVKTVLKIAKKHKILAIDAGVVEKGPKKVIIKPLEIEFLGESLNIR
jgi:phosphoribosylformylglycinamidine cyclo-ligase